MLRFLIDENFDQRILRGLRLLLPHFDYILVQHADMSGLVDPALLAWAANEDRIVITRDVNTMTRYANERMKQGLTMPGVIVVPDDLEIGHAIADLEVIVECGSARDPLNQIQYLPL